MKNKKIISAGHICLDITPIFSTKQQFTDINQILEPGKLITMNPADVHSGGSVANTGLALKLLGGNVSLMGKVGDDAFGGMLQSIIADYGAGGLIVDENSSTSYSVVLAIPGIDRIFLHNSGANDTFTNSDILENELNDASWFHFGYPPLMQSMYINGGRELISIFKRVRDKGIITSLDFAAIDAMSEAGQADWMSILKGVLPFVDYFVPSFEELVFMIDRARFDRLSNLGGDMIEHINLEDDAKPLIDRLLELGANKIMIKCGTKGICYFDGTRIGYQPCFKPDMVVSGTGAGDTSIAAFIMAIVQGRTMRRAVQIAAAEGACAVTTIDALSGIRSIEDLEARIDSGWECL